MTAIIKVFTSVKGLFLYYSLSLFSIYTFPPLLFHVSLFTIFRLQSLIFSKHYRLSRQIRRIAYQLAAPPIRRSHRRGSSTTVPDHLRRGTAVCSRRGIANQPERKPGRLVRLFEPRVRFLAPVDTPTVCDCPSRRPRHRD